jgi:hypothetical protein
MAYSASLAHHAHEMASFVDIILKGAKPAERTVAQPTKFERAINLKTAKAPGLIVAATLLARPDKGNRAGPVLPHLLTAEIGPSRGAWPSLRSSPPLG